MRRSADTPLRCASGFPSIFNLQPSTLISVVVIGLSHHSSPVELRERFAFADAKIPGALKSLRESGIASEAVILSTCNRVEIYAATALAPEAAFAELKKFLGSQSIVAMRDSVLDCGSPLPLSNATTEAPEGWRTPKPDGNSQSPLQGGDFSGEEIYTLAEPQSLHHLFKVASGLDSMGLSETEILGQLKDAYKVSHHHKHTS